MNRRRLLLSIGLGLTATLLSGCMSLTERPVEADGTYCHRIGKSYRQKRTCTALAVPSDATEAGAKRFEPVSDAGTLYIVRRRWGDTANRVPVSVDDRPALATIPDSVVRVHLGAGNHQMVIEWQGKRQVKAVNIRAGEIVFVEVEGSVWAWGSTYRWAEPDAEGARRRASRSKLVADINLSP